MKKTRGVIYTAGGLKRYVDEAIYSAKTLKKHNPNIKTTLFTTLDGVKSKYIDNIVYQNPIKHPQKYKIENMLLTPYDYTLYLDSDTKILDNIEELFDFLLLYDMGITNRVKCNFYDPPKPTEFLDYIDYECYQGGFLLFKKNEKTTTFISSWAKKMEVKSDVITGKPIGDQPLLNELFFAEKLPEKLDLRFVILPNKIYNARPWLWKQAKTDNVFKNIKILHDRNLNVSLFTQYINKLKHKIKQYANK